MLYNILNSFELINIVWKKSVTLQSISLKEARYGFWWVGCRHNGKRLPTLVLDILKSDSFKFLVKNAATVDGLWICIFVPSTKQLSRERQGR